MRQAPSLLHVLFNLIEVQMPVECCVVLARDALGFMLLSHPGDVALLDSNGGQSGTGHNTLMLLQKQLGKLRLLVDTTVALSRT